MLRTVALETPRSKREKDEMKTVQEPEKEALESMGDTWREWCAGN